MPHRSSLRRCLNCISCGRLCASSNPSNSPGPPKSQAPLPQIEEEPMPGMVQEPTILPLPPSAAHVPKPRISVPERPAEEPVLGKPEEPENPPSPPPSPGLPTRGPSFGMFKLYTGSEEELEALARMLRIESAETVVRSDTSVQE
ncbi:hypothetical protein EDC01DRAFT_629785 [Geopyxis carbonaria]|nr:hypothetical protein EDC01DRAFT_629785 [Geopyxis carbonaria]